MSIRRPLRGKARELAEGIAQCRAALDRGELTLARTLERELYLSALRAIAGDSKRPRRLAFLALSLSGAVDERLHKTAAEVIR